jgi:hypothetical protein
MQLKYEQYYTSSILKVNQDINSESNTTKKMT